MAATSPSQVPALSDSLYELTIATEPSLKPIPTSPVLFKSVLESTLAMLAGQPTVATIWVKLPSDPVWQIPLQSYCQAQPSSQIYSLIPTQMARAAEPQPEPESIPLPDFSEQFEEPVDLNDDTQDKSLNPQASIQRISLANSAVLRREYFLLVVAEGWCSFVLAHRQRSTQVPEVSPDHPMPPLLLLQSIQGQTIGQVLTHLQGLLAGDSSATESPCAAVVWEQQLAVAQRWAGDVNLMADWFSHHLQQQHVIWQRFIHLRQQESHVEILRSQNEHLIQELHRKDEFLNTVGQELRAPLSNMKTALSLLNSPQLKVAQRQRYMQMLSTECDRQSSLITSMLNLVQLDADVEQDAFHPINLADIIPGVVSTYQPLAQEKGIMLAYTIPDDLPSISCLDGWVRQIAVNLLHNSIKFTASGGRVWVKAKQQGEYVQLEFQDTGIGIPGQEIPKIFDRFYRVRHTSVGNVTGVGLGLTIVQQILLRCGGSISVKSKVGEGSTFNVLLPIAARAIASA